MKALMIFSVTFAPADRHSYDLAIFFIDLDKFKAVNDTLGHHVGDLLLIQVARRLKSCLRINDFSARIGGDEFAVITIINEEPDETSIIANKIIQSLSESYSIQGHTINIGVSIGIAFYPNSGTLVEDVISKADSAMYRAKEFGGNKFEIASA